MSKHIYFLFLFFLLLDNDASGQSKSSFQHAAKEAFLKEDYAASFNFYVTALEYGDDPYLMLMAGDCKRRLFEYNTALAWLNKSINEDSKHRYPQNYYLKAETHLALGQLDEAQKMINNFLYTDSSLTSKNQAEKFQQRLDNATVLLSTKDSIDLFDAGTNVNTAFSDFAATTVNDSTMLFSSLRYESQNKKKTEYSSQILKARMDSASIYKPVLLPDEIDNNSWHNCNASVSPDGKIMIFSRCNYNSENKLICKLYESMLVNNKWQQPVLLNNEINTDNHTSTQPCISSAGTEGYHLFYVSDRNDSKGFTDIYYSKRNAKGEYAASTSVKTVNTPGREVSPFFNPITGILYFSSDSLNGLGAFDIYKVNISDSASAPVNLGLPYNSGYNDIYYSEDLRNSRHGFISSNRPGTLELNGSVCCYDIFRFKPTLPEEVKITAIEVQNITPVAPINEKQNDPLTLEGNLKQLLPLKLYFDNDYPDPKSVKPTTSAIYQDLYTNYAKKIEDYITGFSSDKSRNEDDSRDAIEKFFITELQYNYKQLDKFSAMLETTLKNGFVVKLTVQGYASPLAETRYNLILSARRISSIINYWSNWQDKKLSQYITTGQLTINEVPSGERDDKDISDKLNDKANSVYNPTAARERRIEVINVTISKP